MDVSGKISIQPTVKVQNLDDLAQIYTPGVGDEVNAIAADPSAADNSTNVRNSVLIVTDGSAVLGIGDVGPFAALPVMEGKSALFKTFANIDAWPLCLRSRNVDDVVRTICDVSPTVGAINLEDISAPRCFEITGRLNDELDIPVFHDDQHGTAVIVLAALHNALTVVQKNLTDAIIVISGAGAAGSAIARLLVHAGAADVIVCDRHGVISSEVSGLHNEKQWLARNTNHGRRSGSLEDCLEGADVFIGVSAPDIIDADAFTRMREEPIVFGLANPNPEFDADYASRYAAVVATGRSDKPNQINNALVFPGLFRGLLDSRLSTSDESVHHAVARAISELVDEPGDHNIVPDIFDERLVPAIARAVANCIP